MTQDHGHDDDVVDSTLSPETATLDEQPRSPDDSVASVDGNFLRLQIEGSEGYRLIPLHTIAELDVSGIGGLPPTQLVVRTLAGTSVSLAGSASAIETLLAAIRNGIAA